MCVLGCDSYLRTTASHRGSDHVHENDSLGKAQLEDACIAPVEQTQAVGVWLEHLQVAKGKKEAWQQVYRASDGWAVTSLGG
jgi:hypothetical protein